MNSQYQVIITGGSSGIGAAFAKHYAENSKRILLVGRRQPELEAVCRKLTAMFPESHCNYMLCDLSNALSISHLGEIIKQNHELETLINNAGYNLDGLLTSIDLQSHKELCNTHMLTTLELTYCALPALVDNKGSLINVASLAAFMPTPLAPLYGPTKAFVKSFTESIAASYYRHGLSAIAVCPGFTMTDFHKRLDLNPKTFYKKKGLFKAKTPEDVVKQAIKDLQKRRTISIAGFNYQLIAFALKHTPDRLIQKIAQRIRKARVGSG